MTLTMCSGLPASGKSTWAKSQNAVRVNKDDIRIELTAQGWTWSHENEKDVVKIRDQRISEALRAGHDVISDDTNFGHKHRARLKQLARQFKADFEEKFFPITIEEAIQRDATREHSVGEEVIRRMAAEFLPPPVVPYVDDPALPWCVMCDLDGTAALITDRSPYDGASCGRDRPNVPVRMVLRCLGMPVLYMSGRDSAHMVATDAWLKKHDFPHGPLHMRTTGDRRKDAIVKSELFDRHVRGRWNVAFVLDDRNQVVEMWRALGLTVFQVADGNF